MFRFRVGVDRASVGTSPTYGTILMHKLRATFKTLARRLCSSILYFMQYYHITLIVFKSVKAMLITYLYCSHTVWL